MAIDPNDDDEHRDATPNDDEDESDLVPIKRQKKSLVARKSLPTVESALDDFIIQANQKLMDVAEFTPETREQGLRDEIADLKKKLAAAEAKAAAAAAAASTATEAPQASGGPSWGAIIGAFVVGAGIMFAVGKLTSSDAPRPAAQPTPTAVAPSEPAPSPPTPTPAPVVDPVAHQSATGTTPTAPATATTPTTTAQAPSEPVAAPRPKQPTVAAKQPPKQPPRQQPTPKQPSVPAAGQDGAAPKPTPPQDGSGSDLYNPF